MNLEGLQLILIARTLSFNCYLMNIPLILCGGIGKRLWPISTQNKPKQFHNLFGDKSLFQETILRLKHLPVQNPIILTTQDNLNYVKANLQAIDVQPLAMICEPVMRNTAPAIISGALYALRKFHNPNLLILPSDHLILGNDEFTSSLSLGLKECSSKKIITFGIKPTRPETGFGYLKLGQMEDNHETIKIDKFIEKPDLDKATQYLASKKFLWNSGMFAFSANHLITEANNYCSSLLSNCKLSIEDASTIRNEVFLSKEHYEKCENQSIDYAVMEKVEDIYTLPLNCEWVDAGSWNALREYGLKDENNNVTSGEIRLSESNNNYIRNDGSTLVVSGINDSIIINSKEGVLVSSIEKADNLKDLTETSKVDPLFNQGLNYVSKPWGGYTVLDVSKDYQLKSIKVLPGESLSLQSHEFRQENWIIVDGEATVELDGEKTILSKGNSIFIPIKSKHRLSNFGKKNLTIIEVQTGTYFGEDDIIRYEDDYGREDIDE